MTSAEHSPEQDAREAVPAASTAGRAPVSSQQSTRRMGLLAERGSSPEQIARENALKAVVAPASLSAPEDAPGYLQKSYAAARRLYAEIVVSGAEGVELRALTTKVGKAQCSQAVKLLRGSGAVVEKVEQRPGGEKPLIVFRAVEE